MTKCLVTYVPKFTPSSRLWYTALHSSVIRICCKNLANCKFVRILYIGSRNILSYDLLRKRLWNWSRQQYAHGIELCFSSANTKYLIQNSNNCHSWHGNNSLWQSNCENKRIALLSNKSPQNICPLQHISVAMDSSRINSSLPSTDRTTYVTQISTTCQSKANM